MIERSDTKALFDGQEIDAQTPRVWRITVKRDHGKRVAVVLVCTQKDVAELICSCILRTSRAGTTVHLNLANIKGHGA